MIHARYSDDSTATLCGYQSPFYRFSLSDTLALPGQNHETTCPDCRQAIAANVVKRMKPKPGIAFNRDAFTMAAADLPMPAPTDDDD